MNENSCRCGPCLVAGIDLGVNNLAVITANQPGFTPLLVNGRPLKALNQWYNKVPQARLTISPAPRRAAHLAPPRCAGGRP